MSIQLTPEQQKALDHEGATAHRVVDPRTRMSYILVPENEYEAMRELLDEERRQTGIHAVALRNAAARLDEVL